MKCVGTLCKAAGPKYVVNSVNVYCRNPCLSITLGSQSVVFMSSNCLNQSSQEIPISLQWQLSLYQSCEWSMFGFRSLSKDTQQTHLNEHGQRHGGRGRRDGEILASTIKLHTVYYCTSRCFIYSGNTAQMKWIILKLISCEKLRQQC